MGVKSIYTDAQWRWLHEQYMKGHDMRSLAAFAFCDKSTLIHHWNRLGLSRKRFTLEPLSREEFLKVGE